MKKRKLKLNLNKTTVVKLQDSQIKNLYGGETTWTLNNTCLDRSEYPACKYTGNYPGGPCNTGTYQ